MPRYADDEYVNRAMPGATAVAGMSSRGGGGEDERVKSDEAALRQVANTLVRPDCNQDADRLAVAAAHRAHELRGGGGSRDESDGRRAPG